MKVFERYFNRNVPSFYPEFSGNLSLIVILPVFDEPELFRTLDSLAACLRTGITVGVILVVNHPDNCEEEIKKRNEATYNKLQEYKLKSDNPGIQFCVARAFDLPASDSGVGVVRKMAMDAAAWYFYQNGRTDGIIASLDADTLVESNYFEELYRCFAQTNVAGVAIYYAHVLEIPDRVLRDAIVKYETYLRYYCRALHFSGHPYAYSCIGSAFACRVLDYVAQGGMNKRQAGEDFYFLQKLIATGRFANLNTTAVYPSARVSSRTPFGTGQSVAKIIADDGIFLTYNWNAFRELKSFFEGIPLLYKEEGAMVYKYMNRQSAALCEFLKNSEFPQKIREINANVASLPLFRKRFFDYFNAFRVLKYLNFVHAGYFERQCIEEAVYALFNEFSQKCPPTLYEVLLILRDWDRREISDTGSFSL